MDMTYLEDLLNQKKKLIDDTQKEYDFLKSIMDKNVTDNIHNICEKYGIKNYTINPDGSIDVKGTVNLYQLNLTELPLTFNKVTGDFKCWSNQLTSLKGSPKEVGGDFNCSGNLLTSFQYSPEKVGENFHCWQYNLTNLKYIPDCDGLYCDNNKIPLYEYRYIFMHKVNKIVTSNKEYDKFLNDLLKKDLTIPEKMQELQKHVNTYNL